MSQSVIGALRANLGLDSTQFVRGANQAQRRLQTMRRQFLAVAGTVAAFGAVLTRVALRGAADIDRVVKAARRIDGSAGAFQALELAAGELGVSLSALTNDLQTLNRELASNSAGAQRAMERLGLSAQDLLAMDADDRVAAIADRVRDLGLSAGETTALLRDLGIRNREMALLFLQGGDAIRAARVDIRDYGLEIDEALGARVERARDQISRLSIVTQYFGQRVAAEVVPSLGAFAQVITDSMREGGLLRIMLDGLVGNLGALVSVGGVAVVLFGTRYVAAMVAARLATMAFTTALLRTGIGALIVGAGFLLDLMVRLRVATGNWGEAAALAVGVVREAFGRLTFAAAAWENILVAALQTLSATMAGITATIFETVESAVRALTRGTVAMVNVAIEALETMTNRARQAVNTLISGLNEVPGVNISLLGDVALGRATASDEDGLFGRAAADVRRRQAEAQASADNAVRIAGVMRRMARMPFESVARMRDVLAGTADETGDAADEARRLAEELRAITDGAGGGGGGGGRGAAGAMDDMADATGRAADAADEWGKRFTSHFDGIITGGRRARDVLQSMARQLESRGWQLLGDALSGGGGGGFRGLLGGIFGGFRAEGGPVMAGRSYVVGERGPELFTPGASGQITSNDRLGRGASRVVVELRSDMLRAQIAEGAGEVVTTQAPGVIGGEMSRGTFDRQMGGRFGSKPKVMKR